MRPCSCRRRIAPLSLLCSPLLPISAQSQLLLIAVRRVLALCLRLYDRYRCYLPRCLAAQRRADAAACRRRRAVTRTERAHAVALGLANPRGGWRSDKDSDRDGEASSGEEDDGQDVAGEIDGRRGEEGGEVRSVGRGCIFAEGNTSLYGLLFPLPQSASASRP